VLARHEVELERLRRALLDARAALVTLGELDAARAGALIACG